MTILLHWFSGNLLQIFIVLFFWGVGDIKKRKKGREKSPCKEPYSLTVLCVFSFIEWEQNFSHCKGEHVTKPYVHKDEFMSDCSHMVSYRLHAVFRFKLAGLQ